MGHCRSCFPSLSNHTFLGNVIRICSEASSVRVAKPSEGSGRDRTAT
uniref:Uncharacterized protein n=1 Tax=Arundo donax TaxID=35708 RepID=A0A0A9F342_ARUDO